MKNQKNHKEIFACLVAAVMVGMLFTTTHGSTVVATSVSDLQAQSNALQQQINSNNALAKQLQTQANTLQNQISILNLQISQLQAQMQLTENKLNVLQDNLAKTQAELDNQKDLLKASIQELYKKSGASTVELLIGSDSFSQFINEQTYMDTLKNGIQNSVEKVITLKQQIQSEQAQQKTLLDEQQSQQSSLVSTQNQQQSLLDQTQGQEAAYKQVVSNLESQQNVINQVIIASSKVYYGGSGGYPWADAQPFNGYYSCPGGDPWGMCERSCTSYTAWKVANVDGDMPTWGFGNAGDWTQDAQNQGIPTGTTPRAHAVANWTRGQFGPYGHVAFVEVVNSDGSVLVSEYNFVAPGQYDERLMTPGQSVMPDHYIYF